MGLPSVLPTRYAQDQHSPTYGDPTQAAEIAHQVRRLSHHPSLVVYTSCNECIFHGNMTLYVNFAMEVVAAEEKTRAVWPSCPASGWNSGVFLLSVCFVYHVEMTERTLGSVERVHDDPPHTKILQ